MLRIARIWLVLVVFAQLTSDLKGKEIISWSQERLSVQLFRGTASLMNVTFTSSQNLSDIDVVVVPEIRPFVSATPSHLILGLRSHGTLHPMLRRPSKSPDTCSQT
jgi:hypothetical protein